MPKAIEPKVRAKRHETSIWLWITSRLKSSSIINAFRIEKLAYIRDLFVFASFTALSFVDIKELTTDDIVEINGEKWILSKRHKTKVNFQVKLLDIPLQIIKRYERFQEDKLVFPNLNYWNICKPQQSYCLRLLDSYYTLYKAIVYEQTE